MKRPLLVDLFLLKVGTVLKKKKNLESLNIISVQNLFKLTLPDVLSWSNQSGIPLKHNNDKGRYSKIKSATSKMVPIQVTL